MMQRALWALRFRRRRASSPARRRVRRGRHLAWAGVTVLSLLAALVAPWLAHFYAQATQGLPPPEALPAWVAFPQGRVYRFTQIADRQGNPMAVYRAPEGLFTPLEDLPPFVATVFPAVLRLEDGLADPAEAVARRLVTLWLLPEDAHAPQGWSTALRVSLLTRQIRQRYGDPTLLLWYLNSVPLGHEAYGLDAAARLYFGHGARNLTLAETVTLAAVALSPEINPLTSASLSQERRDAWLDRLAAAGVLTPEQAQQARQAPLPAPQAPPKPGLSLAERLALRQAATQLHWPAPSRGLILRTTLDQTLQTQAACLLRSVIQARPEPGCPAAQRLPAGALVSPLPEGTTAEALVLQTDDAALLAYAAFPDTAQPGRFPAGSALSPWVYLTAFSRGLAPASLIWDLPAALPPGVEITNPDGRFHGPLSLRSALANGYLVPTAALLHRLGPETVWQTARQVGLAALPPAADAQPFAWIAGAEGELGLLEVAYALLPLANLGALPGYPWGPRQQLVPGLTWQARTTDGVTMLPEQRPQRRLAVSAGLAYLVTHVLRDAPARWPAFGHPNPLEIGRPVAAYVGLAQEGQVAWVLGYTPSRVVAVVMQVPQGQARTPALALWHALAQYALQDLPPEDWPMPPEVTTMAVCAPSGLLPTADCPTVVNEVFLLGNEPTAPDDLYRRLAVNRETGLLATIFTPPELVEERVYLQIPPEARAWAAQAGLPLPPQEYDLIVPPAPPPQAHLTSPSPFDEVGPRVVLQGTAAGERFAGYRIQVGEGINPQTWVTVARGDRPVVQGTLGVWQTADLPEGLYTLQLQVTTTDRRVLSHTLQVTVDHTPPRLMVLYPVAEQKIPYQPRAVLLVHARAEDAYGVAEVRLLVDGREVTRQTRPPYTLAWPLHKGRHTLTVEAVDRAGNRSPIQVTVEVVP